MWDDYDTPVDNPEKKYRMLMRLFLQCMELFSIKTEVVDTKHDKASLQDAWKQIMDKKG